MGLIQFTGIEPVPAQESRGFTRLARHPDGQRESYQPLEFQQEALATPPLDEESAQDSEFDATELPVTDVTEQLHAFTHMSPVFVRHEEAQRLQMARQAAEPALPGIGVDGTHDESSAASTVLRALSRHDRPDTARAPMAEATFTGRDKPMPSTEFARLLAQPAGQGERPVLSDKLVASLQPLLGDGTSEREALLPDLKAMSTHLASSPLTRTAEYQWAPARLADSPAQWGQQLVDVLKDKVELQVNQSIKQAHIRLDPPELGRLELTVRIEGDKLNVQLNVTNPAVREALIQSMERLRMSLAPHHAGGVEVNVGQGGEQERGDRWQQDKILAGRRQWQEEFEASDRPGQEWLNTLV